MHFASHRSICRLPTMRPWMAMRCGTATWRRAAGGTSGQPGSGLHHLRACRATIDCPSCRRDLGATGHLPGAVRLRLSQEAWPTRVRARSPHPGGRWCNGGPQACPGRRRHPHAADHDAWVGGGTRDSHCKRQRRYGRFPFIRRRSEISSSRSRSDQWGRARTNWLVAPVLPRVSFGLAQPQAMDRVPLCGVGALRPGGLDRRVRLRWLAG